MIHLLAQLDTSQLRTTLQYYSDWGVAVGLGMYACFMFATLLGILIRSL
jgi:hypothetical protein